MNRFIIKSLIFLSLLTAVACTEGSCFDETESYLKATFYTTFNERDVALAPDTFSMSGLGLDSIYKKTLTLKVALFPLNASAENSKFIITINKISDTVEFTYSSYPHLISKECGYTYYHQLVTDTILHTNNKFRYQVMNKTITNLNVENIRIFY